MENFKLKVKKSFILVKEDIESLKEEITLLKENQNRMIDMLRELKADQLRIQNKLMEAMIR